MSSKGKKAEYHYFPPEPHECLTHFNKYMRRLGKFFTYRQIRDNIMFGRCPFRLPLGAPEASRAAVDRVRASNVWTTMTLYRMSLDRELNMWMKKHMLLVAREFYGRKQGRK